MTPTKTAFLARINGKSSSKGVALDTSSIIATSKLSRFAFLSVFSFSLQETATKLQFSMKLVLTCSPVLANQTAARCYAIAQTVASMLHLYAVFQRIVFLTL